MCKGPDVANREPQGGANGEEGMRGHKGEVGARLCGGFIGSWALMGSEMEPGTVFLSRRVGAKSVSQYRVQCTI